MRKLFLLLFGSSLIVNAAFARSPEDSLQREMEAYFKQADSIEKSLTYQKGKIQLGNGIADINIPEGFKFLNAEQAKYVVEDIWGNPPAATPVLGMIFPESSGATDPGGFAFVIQFDEMGYVKDKDADKINYDDLLKELKESSAQQDVERVKAGLQPLTLVGWAATPRYDRDKKILYWAKEFSSPDNESNTLNYDIRVLGRKGVLILQAVSSMEEIDSVNNNLDDVLQMVSFTEGNRYADFDSGTDNVAAWTIGGLVAGKVLAKVGFFALILKNLKLIVIGIGLLAGAVWKFITGRRKKKEEEFVYQPQTVVTNETKDPV